MTFDANAALKQIGTGNLMSCGARDFVAGPDSLTFRVGPSSKLSKVLVTLDESDTYTVRYVEVRRRTCEITVDESVSFVHADNLGAVVRKMGDR